MLTVCPELYQAHDGIVSCNSPHHPLKEGLSKSSPYTGGNQVSKRSHTCAQECELLTTTLYYLLKNEFKAGFHKYLVFMVNQLSHFLLSPETVLKAN